MIVDLQHCCTLAILTGNSTPISDAKKEKGSPRLVTLSEI
jgi:hypothetical protein